MAIRYVMQRDTRARVLQIRISCGLAVLLLCGMAIAQAPQNTVLPSADSCRLTVSKFEQDIGLVRQYQGNQAAAALKERLLPAALESDLLTTKGYCGLAAYLKEKKLDR